MSEVLVETKGAVYTVIINRPEIKNCVNRKTADQMADAFRAFDNDPNYAVAVLYGTGGTFCAGADLKDAVHVGDPDGPANRMDKDMTKDGPMGPSRMQLSKPVIAAVSGYAVAGGMELALWCDLRVMEKDAIFGVFCRRFGVPLIDGGTQRLPRLIGLSRAMDLILTGRPVNADEALQIGLANRVVEPGTARSEAEKLAEQIAAFPRQCMLSDRQAVYEGFNMNFQDAMEQEFLKGYEIVMVSGETVKGASKFTAGVGRHGKF
ncbi:MAG TPA: crotonase/enoyl-CoA hydratase family protein [Syntrophomonas sp.]|jgi:enoyl-CoA hydratase|nr:crotonase/enoyl-CoA hydratase family protein [Syntrophomonas sp.]